MIEHSFRMSRKIVSVGPLFKGHDASEQPVSVQVLGKYSPYFDPQIDIYAPSNLVVGKGLPTHTLEAVDMRGVFSAIGLAFSSFSNCYENNSNPVSPNRGMHELNMEERHMLSSLFQQQRFTPRKSKTNKTPFIKKMMRRFRPQDSKAKSDSQPGTNHGSKSLHARHEQQSLQGKLESLFVNASLDETAGADVPNRADLGGYSPFPSMEAMLSLLHAKAIYDLKQREASQKKLKPKQQLKQRFELPKFDLADDVRHLHGFLSKHGWKVTPDLRLMLSNIRNKLIGQVLTKQYNRDEQGVLTDDYGNLGQMLRRLKQEINKTCEKTLDSLGGNIDLRFVSHLLSDIDYVVQCNYKVTTPSANLYYQYMLSPTSLAHLLMKTYTFFRSQHAGERQRIANHIDKFFNRFGALCPSNIFDLRSHGLEVPTTYFGSRIRALQTDGLDRLDPSVFMLKAVLYQALFPPDIERSEHIAKRFANESHEFYSLNQLFVSTSQKNIDRIFADDGDGVFRLSSAFKSWFTSAEKNAGKQGCMLSRQDATVICQIGHQINVLVDSHIPLHKPDMTLLSNMYQLACVAQDKLLEHSVAYGKNVTLPISKLDVAEVLKPLDSVVTLNHQALYKLRTFQQEIEDGTIFFQFGSDPKAIQRGLGNLLDSMLRLAEHHLLALKQLEESQAINLDAFVNALKQCASQWKQAPCIEYSGLHSHAIRAFAVFVDLAKGRAIEETEENLALKEKFERRYLDTEATIIDAPPGFFADGDGFRNMSLLVSADRELDHRSDTASPSMHTQHGIPMVNDAEPAPESDLLPSADGLFRSPHKQTGTRRALTDTEDIVVTLHNLWKQLDRQETLNVF